MEFHSCVRSWNHSSLRHYEICTCPNCDRLPLSGSVNHKSHGAHLWCPCDGKCWKCCMILLRPHLICISIAYWYIYIYIYNEYVMDDSDIADIWESHILLELVNISDMSLPFIAYLIYLKWHWNKQPCPTCIHIETPVNNLSAIHMTVYLITLT